MKRFLYITLLVVLHQSCSNALVLTNRTFVTDNPYKKDALEFVNDSICIYEQVFLCDLDDQYKVTKTTCTYKTQKKSIILMNTDLNADSTCFRLPETELKKCHFFNEELDSQTPLRLGAPKKITNVDAYGYIDVITIDTLKYKSKTIIHNKWNYCAQFPIYTSIPFYEDKGNRKSH